MHRTLQRPRTQTRLVLAGAVVTAIGMLVSWLLAAGPAEAATKSPVTIKSIGTTARAAAGTKVTVKPRYTVRKGVKVRSARISVRHGSRWVVRKARSARLAPGKYRVTTKVTYQVRRNGSHGPVRTAGRTQTLRVLTPAPILVETGSSPVTTASISRTGAPCDTSSLRKADGSAWRCTFVDEFQGTSLDTSRWLPQQTASSGYRISSDCYVDSPETIAVGGGVLALTARKAATSFTCASPAGSYAATHTAGMVSTWSSFAQAYGRFEIRAAFPATSVPGHHGALWLFPKDSPYGSYPYSGEIDIAEFYSQWWDRAIPYIHYGLSAYDPTVTNTACMIKDVSSFHTYTLEWTPTTLTIAYDGKTCVSHRINGLSASAGSAPFDHPFMLVLTQGLGIGDNAATSRTPAVGTTRVDYVRVWK